MKLDLSEVKTGLDRLATSEEIRTAISLLPNYIFEVENETLFEVSSDLGGFVQVNLEEEVLELIEGANETVN